MGIGSKLTQLRKERKLTQDDAGRQLGVSSRVLSHYETDIRFPRETDTLIRIVDFYNVSLDWLFDRTADRVIDASAPGIDRIDVSDLSEEALSKLKEYIAMLRQFHEKKE